MLNSAGRKTKWASWIGLSSLTLFVRYFSTYTKVRTRTSRRIDRLPSTAPDTGYGSDPGGKTTFCLPLDQYAKKLSCLALRWWDKQSLESVKSPVATAPISLLVDATTIIKEDDLCYSSSCILVLKTTVHLKMCAITFSKLRSTQTCAGSLLASRLSRGKFAAAVPHGGMPITSCLTVSVNN